MSTENDDIPGLNPLVSTKEADPSTNVSLNGSFDQSSRRLALQSLVRAFDEESTKLVRAPSIPSYIASKQDLDKLEGWLSQDVAPTIAAAAKNVEKSWQTIPGGKKDAEGLEWNMVDAFMTASDKKSQQTMAEFGSAFTPAVGGNEKTALRAGVKAGLKGLGKLSGEKAPKTWRDRCPKSLVKTIDKCIGAYKIFCAAVNRSSEKSKERQRYEDLSSHKPKTTSSKFADKFRKKGSYKLESAISNMPR